MTRRGWVLVAQHSTSEVFVLDSLLTLRATAGRAGSGPGEFRSVGALWVIDDSTFTVFDSELRRLSTFRIDGRLLHEHGLNAVLAADTGFFFAGVTGITRSGHALVVREAPLQGGPGISRPILHRAMLKADRLQPFGDPVPGRELWEGPPNEDGHIPLGVSPFASTPLAVVCGESVIDASSHSMELKYRDETGRLRQVVRYSRAPIPISDSHIRKKFAEQQPGAAVPDDAFLKLTREMSAETTLPVLDQLLCDPEGGLWTVESAIPGGRWKVATRHGEDGARSLSLRIPARLRVLAVGSDRILAVAVDSDTGEERLEIWRGTATGGPKD
jgi:hypothetical protein